MTKIPYKKACDIFGKDEVEKIEWELLKERYDNFINYINSFDGKLKFANDQEKIQVHNEMIAELKAEVMVLSAQLDEIKELSAGCPDNEDFLYDLTIEYLNKKIKELNRRIRTYQFRNDALMGKEITSKSYDLEAIKQVPIEQIMPSRPIFHSPNREKYICPLHTEKTASFTVYKDTNSWYCWGCNSFGDVIDLYMRLNNCDFQTACGQLLAI